MDGPVLIDALVRWWQVLAGGLALLADVLASGHAVLNKRDPRAAVLWVGLIWLAPVVGVVLYLALGVNRIRRKAHQLRADQPHAERTPSAVGSTTDAELDAWPGAAELKGYVDRVIPRPLWPGNQVTPLVEGDVAYPRMIAAIDAAERSVALCAFIFERDDAGRPFVDALGAALDRGVEVRVLVDAVGARYSRPTVFGALRERGIPTAAFLPTWAPLLLPYINLRNHRKLLVIDGRRAFTGGMNIRAGHRLQDAPAHPVHDVHFEVSGPVVGRLMEVFADDWVFATDEMLDGDVWFPTLQPVGSVHARAIADGPDADLFKLRQVILGGLACARRRVRVVTPYFLPDVEIVSALAVAALRGVAVEVVVPVRGNQRLVDWAGGPQWRSLLEAGCRVWRTPPPFDHTKLMRVDGAWSLIGSTNWDPRSLRLNFELNVECYDDRLAAELDALIDGKQAVAARLTVADLDRRRLPVRLRDGVARLLSPYL